MKLTRLITRAASSIAFALAALPALAQGFPAPQEGSWIVRDFRFHTGEVLPELRLHYTTVGAPTGEPVVILHGTTGRVLLIPGSDQTLGHGTTGQARFWKRELGELLQTAPRMAH